jgi:hypothetical protein
MQEELQQISVKSLLSAWHNAFGVEGAQTAHAMRQAKRDPALAAAIATNTTGNPGKALGQFFRRIDGATLHGFHISSRPNESGRRGLIWTVKPVPKAVLTLNDEDRDAFLKIPDSPPEPNTPMQTAFSRLHETQIQPAPDETLQAVVVGLHDLINASMSDTQIFFLDRATGEISSKHPPAQTAVMIPQAPKHMRYGWLKEFIAQVPNQVSAEKLTRAIDGEGAFRRFKRTVLEERLSDAYHAFRDEKYAAYIHLWLARLGLRQVEPQRLLSASKIEKEPQPIPVSSPSANLENCLATISVVIFRGLQKGVIEPDQAQKLRAIVDAVVLEGRKGS